MEKKTILIYGAAILVIMAGAIILIQCSKESSENSAFNSPENLEFDKYIFNESEFNSGTAGTAARPTPDCNVRGIITDVEFVEAHDHPCLQKGKEFCPTDTPLHYPSQYVLRIYVQHIQSIEGTGKGYEEAACEDLLKTDATHNFYIRKEKVTEIPKSKLTLEGVVKGSIDLRRFDSYSLEEINY